MRAVVRRERQDPELGELAVADLVGDLSRLHVAFGIVVGRLQAGEAAQRAGGQLRVAGDAHHRDDQRVPAEERHEPWDAGGGDEHAPLEHRVFEAERLHVDHRLVPRPANGLVRRVDPDLREVRAGSRADRADGIAAQRCRPARPRHRQPLHARVPDALGGDRGDEYEPSICELRRGVGLLDQHHEDAPEVAADIRRAQLPP